MNSQTNAEAITTAILRFLSEEEWKYCFDEEYGRIQFDISLQGKLKKLHCTVHVESGEYIVYAVSPLGADADDGPMLASMAEFVCRINSGMKNGNFELNMNNGEIRFKCYVDCHGALPTDEIVRNSILCPAAMFDLFAPGIIDILFGNATGKEMYDHCHRLRKELITQLYGSEKNDSFDTNDCDEIKKEEQE